VTPLDRKVEFVAYADRTLAYVKSAMGYPAIYPVPEVDFTAPRRPCLWIWTGLR